jgi:hypothetical protein
MASKRKATKQSASKRSAQRAAKTASSLGVLATPPKPLLKESAADNKHSFAAKFWPELSVLLSITWVVLAPAHWWQPNLDAQWTGIAIDLVLLMGSATLIDVASRLQRAPPWWIAPIAVIGLIILSPGSGELLGLTFELSSLILLPFAWAVIERVRELWTLPAASVLEKIRRRTLVFDRVYVVLVLGVIAALFGLGVYVLFDMDLTSWLSKVVLIIVWLFYAIACFNVWRVHQASFVQHPRSLLPWIDQNEASELRPL